MSSAPSLRTPIAFHGQQDRGLLWAVARDFGAYSGERDRGKIRHRLTFWIGGRRYRLSTLRHPNGIEFPLRTKTEALKLLEVIRAGLRGNRSGLHIDEAKMQALSPFLSRSAPEVQVHTWLQRWLELQRGRCEAGEISPTYLRELERWAKPGGHFSYWDGWTIWEPSYGALEDWNKALGPTLSPKSRKNLLGAFRVFLRWLEKRKEIHRSPVFPTIKVADHAPVIISPATQRAVLGEIPEDRRGAFIGQVDLGLRPGEIRALNVGDYRDGWLMIAAAMKGPSSKAPRRGTKEGNVRRLPVREGSPDLAAWIERWVDPADRLQAEPLFTNPTGRSPDKRWLSNALRLEWNRAAERAGVRVKNYEGTKHSFATALAARGERLEHIQKVLGHKDPRSTSKYATLADQAVVETLRRRPKTAPQQPHRGESENT